jgi:hypothetical protein
MDGRIMVKLNKDMGDDGALGKAKRKIYKQMYDRLTNSQFTTADADLDERPVVNSGAATSSLEDKLAERAKALGAGAEATKDAPGETAAGEVAAEPTLDALFGAGK